MSKRISIMLVFLVLVSGLGFVYGAVPSDVEGTKYEEAVVELVGRGIITGYDDGTFQPDKGINRAEACVVVVKMMGASAGQLTNASDSGFEDMSGYNWAKGYINYAVDNGVVSGYSNTIFGPEREVTVNEMAAMLVNALGYDASELTGSWPSNYYNKAVELEIINDSGSAAVEGNMPASRGDVAVMTYNALNIDEQEAPDDKDNNSNEDNNSKDDENKTNDKDKQTDEEYKKLAGDLYDFSARAYGIILGTATVIDKDGVKVTQIEFLKGNTVHYVNTDGNLKLPDIDYSELELYGLRMNSGIVRGVGSISDPSSLGTNYLNEILGDGNICEVTNVSNGLVTTDGGAFNTSSGTIVYVAKYKGGSIDKFQSGRVSDITAGSYVRAYTVTKDAQGGELAEIVIVDKGK